MGRAAAATDTSEPSARRTMNTPLRHPSLTHSAVGHASRHVSRRPSRITVDILQMHKLPRNLQSPLRSVTGGSSSPSGHPSACTARRRAGKTESSPPPPRPPSGASTCAPPRRRTVRGRTSPARRRRSGRSRGPSCSPRPGPATNNDPLSPPTLGVLIVGLGSGLTHSKAFFSPWNCDA